MAINFIVIKNFFENLFYFAITCPPSDHQLLCSFLLNPYNFPILVKNKIRYPVYHE